MAKKLPSKRWVEHGPLAVWMTEYAQWLAGHPGAELSRRQDGAGVGYRNRHPLVTERAAKASLCAGRRVQVPLIPLLERRSDLRDYFERLRADTRFHSAQLASKVIAKNFEARDLALDKALDRQVDPETGRAYAGDKADVKALVHLTAPFVDHALPKMKLERQEQAPRIVIQIGGAEARRLVARALSEEEEPQEVEWEIVPPKELGDGLDD